MNIEIEGNEKLEKGIEIPENRVKDIVLQLTKQGVDVIEVEDLEFRIIKLLKCDLKTAEACVFKMEELGIELCDESYEEYSLKKFAEMRGYE